MSKPGPREGPAACPRTLRRGTPEHGFPRGLFPSDTSYPPPGLSGQGCPAGMQQVLDTGSGQAMLPKDRPASLQGPRRVSGGLSRSLQRLACPDWLEDTVPVPATPAQSPPSQRPSVDNEGLGLHRGSVRAGVWGGWSQALGGSPGQWGGVGRGPLFYVLGELGTRSYPSLAGS